VIIVFHAGWGLATDEHGRNGGSFVFSTFLLRICVWYCRLLWMPADGQ
jgi:hypothetical protein